ncbi:conserved hypothetical protein [Oleispira antarctica RB-8]|uniref:Uncharacterized protein n=1 Tax=Oleispira antarctica RB-8 TaxID=698738 RepID=R4YN58_OLEAN|nr:conserved hypothetical protein [Oleispira antarctica RB-8]
MSTIKTIKDLPSWFSLDNYRNLDSSEEALLSLIAEREVRFHILGGGASFTHNETFMTHIRKLGMERDSSISTPANYVSWNNGFPQLNPEENPTCREYLPEGEAVQAFSLVDIHQMGLEAEVFLDNLPLDEDCVKSYDSLARHTVGKNKLSLSINLHLPDYQIIEELKKLLPQYREYLESPGPRKQYKRADLSKILSYKILPLADLTLWAKAEGKHIPLSVLAVSLFPDGSRGEEDIRKTVIPFMEKVMSHQYIYEWKSSFLGK